jgi:hypothetical protein
VGDAGEDELQTSQPAQVADVGEDAVRILLAEEGERLKLVAPQGIEEKGEPFGRGVVRL